MTKEFCLITIFTESESMKIFCVVNEPETHGREL